MTEQQRRTGFQPPRQLSPCKDRQGRAKCFQAGDGEAGPVSVGAQLKSISLLYPAAIIPFVYLRPRGSHFPCLAPTFPEMKIGSFQPPRREEKFTDAWAGKIF